MTTQSLPQWALGRVVASTPVAQDVRRIVIARPPRGRAAPGSHVDVRVPLGGFTDVRSYSVVESSDDGGLITISVLRVPRSRGGSAYISGLSPGDDIEVTQPLQNFPLRIGAPRYVLLAGGIGITALAEMARVLRLLGADYTLVYVGRSRERMSYVVELAELHGDRLVLHVDAEGCPLDVGELVRSVDDRTELYMCGPIRLMDDVRRNWQDAGLPPANLRYETFGSSGWFEPEEFVARLPQRRVETTVRTDETLLEALTRAGVDLMYDCRKGECGLCLLDVSCVEGAVDHRDVFLSAAQQTTGRSLATCVSRVVARSGSGVPPVVELTIP
jgi:vanillate O-demethylase ferredoxin subunit